MAAPPPAGASCFGGVAPTNSYCARHSSLPPQGPRRAHALPPASSLTRRTRTQQRAVVSLFPVPWSRPAARSHSHVCMQLRVRVAACVAASPPWPPAQAAARALLLPGGAAPLLLARRLDLARRLLGRTLPQRPWRAPHGGRTRGRAVPGAAGLERGAAVAPGALMGPSSRMQPPTAAHSRPQHPLTAARLAAPSRGIRLCIRLCMRLCMKPPLLCCTAV